MSSLYCYVDIDPRTKKKWWYTLSNSKKQSSLEIPLEYRNLFDGKVLTYSECFLHLSMDFKEIVSPVH